MISSKTAAELVAILNETDESEDIEVKEISTDQLGKSIWETVSSFSNEPGLEGGTILLGVREEQALFRMFTASGVGDVDKLIRDIATGAANTFNVPVRVDIAAEKVGSATVIRIDVPEAHSSQKPIFLKKQGLPGGAFRRIGSTDQRCTPDDLVAFFQSKAQEPYDTHIVSDARVEDLEQGAIADYRAARAEANPLAEELNWSDSDLLQSLNAIKRTPEGLSVTATGVFTFGSTQALRRLFPTHRVDYIQVSGKSWISDHSESYESTDMRGPLIGLIRRLLSNVLSDLPKTFRFDENSGQRREIPAIPQRVIREAIVNAVMHRDYQVHQPTQIIRYSNRLVIKNPGYSLKAEERFDDPGSAVRNPHIAEVLHEVRFAEQKGSGIRVMRQTMNEMGLSSPAFGSNRANNEFSATFLFHHFLGESDWQWLSNFSGYDLSEDQMRALIFVRETGAIDNSAYRGLMYVDTLTASKRLRAMKAEGLLRDEGSGSRTHYVAGPALLDFLSEGASIHAKGSSILTKDVVSGGRVERSDLPPALRSRIEALGRRVTPDVMERLIIDLCSWRPLSAEEVAAIFGRTNNYISTKYLYRMIRERRLTYLYPKMVKHPGQKYKVERHDE
ncbi:MAG: ATP-binding protein [Parvularcula sp.]|jgi:ATP-dependent DNA helicase RecG|nr:ATP-binding protein [Parvularcula sp.]